MDNQKVMELKKRTNVNLGTAKEALAITNYDFDQAVQYIRDQGIKIAKKRRYKLTKYQVIGSYLHHNQKIGAMVELGCESESTSASDYFKEFANDIAMQIASNRCTFISRTDVPLDLIQKIRKDYELSESKDKALDQLLAEYYRENCLLEQKYIKDESLTIDELILEFIYTHQENIEINKFVRYEV